MLKKFNDSNGLKKHNNRSPESQKNDIHTEDQLRVSPIDNGIEMTTEELMVKIILLGNGSVGKTSLASRFAKNTFKSQYQPTLGVNLLVKFISYQGQYIKLLIFDTAGQEFMSSLRKQHYAGANGVIIVFDITSRQSFDGLHQWIREIQEEVGSIKTVIVGNKVDLEYDREILYNEGLSYSQTVRSEYFESSAKENIRVADIFQPFIEDAVKKLLPIVE